MRRQSATPDLDEEIDELLTKYSGLVVRPRASDRDLLDGDRERIEGTLRFRTVADEDLPELEASFGVKIVVPGRFPRALPRVYCTDGSIPKEYHTNPQGDLCLGARLRLHSILSRRPTLLGFIDLCLVPYLYRFRHIGEFGFAPRGWGELDHGAPGLLAEYRKLLGIENARAVRTLLGIGALRKRVANKVVCPCGSGERVGKCHHLIINRLRDECGRGVFREAQSELQRQQGRA